MSMRSFFGRHTVAVAAFAVAAVVTAGVLVVFASAGAKGLPPTSAQQQDDNNPLIYKAKDSRSGFDGGYYKHVVDCPDGYKAISGGFDLNQRSDDPYSYWIIQSSRPGGNVSEEGQNDGQSWVTEAFWIKLSKGPTNFKAFAVCAPQELLPKVDYAFENHTINFSKSKTFWTQCKADERVIGGGFDLLGKETSQRLDLMRTERGDDGRSWGVGVWNDPSGPLSNAKTQIRSYRVCVPAGALKDLDYKSARNTQKDRVSAYTPKCTEGTYLLSGGAGRPNEDTSPRWSRIAPGYDSNKNFTNNWGASAVWHQTVEKTFTVFSFALCGRLADGGGGGQGAGDGGGDGSAFAQLGSVIQCDDELPCDATANHDVLSERAGDEAKDRMIAQGGYDLLRAQSNTNDPDVANGGSGHDVLLVNDGDAKDEAIGAAGTDVCVVDAAKEASGSCEAVIYR